MAVQSTTPSIFLCNIKSQRAVATCCLTSIFRQFPTVDLVFHNISPVQGALVEVKVQSNGVPQAWYKHTELPLVKLNPSDLMTVGENDERLEGV